MKTAALSMLLVVAAGVCASKVVLGKGAADPDVAFCADACAAGLGAPRCGDASLCQPPLLKNKTAVHTDYKAEGAELSGKPRDELCPQLCPLALGDPLCSCKSLRLGPPHGGSAPTHDWRRKACDAVCKATGKSPAGCLPCATETAAAALGVHDIDWDWWCHILCLEGDGGLACLCDINP